MAEDTASWQNIPTSLLDAIDNQQKAQDFAQNQRAQTAHEWGQMQRGITASARPTVPPVKPPGVTG